MSNSGQHCPVTCIEAGMIPGKTFHFRGYMGIILYRVPLARCMLIVCRPTPYAMIRSYLKTAFRNLTRNKLHGIINIAGLSSGMAVAMMISLWIYDELTFDHYHKNYESIAQVIQNVTNNGEVDTWRNTPYPLAEELRKNYGANFKEVILTTGAYNHLLSYNDRQLNQEGMYAEPDFVPLFSFHLIEGQDNALSDASAILISESTAKAFFPDSDPMNKIMLMDGNETVHVAGVYEDLPQNSTFAEVKFLAPWTQLYNDGWIKGMDDPWRPNAFDLYVQIADQTTFEQVSANIRDAKLKKVNDELKKKDARLFLDPMSRWHLYSEFKNGVNTGGRIRYVWLFGIVGAFVLLMACINFMNLSTARSEKRAKEIGVRKAIGSLRRQLILQFLSESILTATISFLIATVLVQLTLPPFNELAEKQIRMPWSLPLFWVLCLGFTLLTGIIAGSYPAFYLSSLKSGSTLKAGHGLHSASLPRRILVVVQFTVSVVLIIGTAVVFEQIQFARNRPLGYESKGVIAIPTINDRIHNHFEAIQNQLIKEQAILSMAEADAPTTENWASTSGLDWDGKDPNLSVDFQFFGVSYDYGKTIGWGIKEGRDFSHDYPADTASLILNEAAAKYMNLKNPIGATVRWFGTPLRVIGVVENLIVGSPYEDARPTIYDLATNKGNFVIVKLNPEVSTHSALSSVEAIFKEYNPQEPFTYAFSDDDYAKKFGNEERIGKLSSVFATLAILISALGIFGLASYIAERRTKEIGVRKVLGASVLNLWGLLSKDFAWLVLLSCLVAFPIAWLALGRWLETYTYHVSMEWWVFISAAVVTLLITMVTVSYQSLTAAMRNPVNSLRAE